MTIPCAREIRIAHTMEVLTLFALVAILIWGAVYLRFTGWWGLVMGTLLVGTVFGHSFYQSGIITLDRLMLGLCIVTYGVLYVWGMVEQRQWNAGDTIFLFFVATMVGTTLIHRDQTAGEAFNKLVFFFVLPSLYYLFGRNFTLTVSKVRGLMLAFTALGTYIALTACAEKFEWTWAVFPRYIADPKIQEFLGRARGPLLNPSGNGVLLGLGLAVSMLIPFWYQGWKRVLLWALVPLSLMGTVCTLTRCVWMSSAVIAVGITTCYVPQRWRVAFLVAIVSIGSVGMIAKANSFVSFKRDKNVSVEDMKESAQLRPYLAMIAWKMFQDHPILGCGTAQYRAKAVDYLYDRTVDMPLEKAAPYVQHNILLALLVENGLLAVVPFCALLMQWTRWSLQLWNARELAVEVRQMGLVLLSTMTAFFIIGMFQDLLIMPMMNAYLFFLAGCIRNLHSNLQPRSVVESSEAKESLGPRRNSASSHLAPA